MVFCAASGSFQRLGSSALAFNSSSRRLAASRSKMPPQQSDRLLDFFFQRKRFGAHGVVNFPAVVGRRAPRLQFARKLVALPGDVKKSLTIAPPRGRMRRLRQICSPLLGANRSPRRHASPHEEKRLTLAGARGVVSHRARPMARHRRKRKAGVRFKRAQRSWHRSRRVQTILPARGAIGARPGQ
jgi:hypothetical protein